MQRGTKRSPRQTALAAVGNHAVRDGLCDPGFHTGESSEYGFFCNFFTNSAQKNTGMAIQDKKSAPQGAF
ncbi:MULTISPECIES: hypothetical protein [Comamonas]|uniref:hypothetical protein n=1 Tax=Comamonas TaxID=283 RepID=UPI00237D48F4|nr:hypothetical protein [Comamonas aquatica]MDE1555992.1 hypothetical protein [Comamonas aquatica]